MTLLAIDIGGSAVKYALAAGNELTAKAEFPTPLTRDSFFTEVKRVLETYATDHDITGIALSCPGEVDEATGQVNGLSFVPFLHLGEFQQTFSEEVQLPVTMINDANSAALAEMTLGIGQGHSTAIFVIIGTGIGMAIVKDGHVVLNSDDKDGELQQIVAEGIKDAKNNKVSLVHISRRVSLKKLQLPSTYDGKDVFALADAGDKIALKEVERMYQSLAEVIISLNLAYEPEIIGIGGGISNNPDLVPNLNERIKELMGNETYLLSAFKAIFEKEIRPTQTPHVEVCKFKNDANLLGAVIHFNHQKG